MIDQGNVQLTLIIVDDNKDDHYFIKQALKKYSGVNIISFYNGETFLEYLKKRSETLVVKKENEWPDIVLLDINMPKLNGFEVFEKTLSLNVKDSIKFYILTTSLTEHDREQCECLGLECFVKPFTPDQFVRILERILETIKKS